MSVFFTRTFADNISSREELNDNEFRRREVEEKLRRKAIRKRLRNDAIITSALGAGVAGVGYLGHRLEKSDSLYKGNPNIKTVKTAGKIGAGVGLAAAGLAGYLHYKDKIEDEEDMY